MRRFLTRAILAAALVAPISAAAADKVVGGPKGGRLVEHDGLRAELFIETDRKVSITFYDEQLKPVPPGDAQVQVIAEAPSGRKTLAIEKKGDVLASTEPLPDGEGYNVVLQLRKTAGAKPKNLRIPLNLHICGECDRAEYACTCDEGGGHDHGSHEGHAH